MPAHKEGYLSKRVDKLMGGDVNRCSVLSIAQSMHEAVGSRVSDLPPRKILEDWKEILEFYILNWYQGESSNESYDCAVRNLIEESLKDYHVYCAFL